MSTPPPSARRPNVLVLATLAVLVIAVLGFVLWQGRGGSSPAKSANAFDLSGQPTLGAANAPVTVVAFEDFKCPACQRYDQTVFPQIQSKYIDTGKIRYAFFNFPFIGPDSVTAAVAGECVVDQKPALFWPYSHVLYRAQKDERTQWATPAYLVELAGLVDGIDTTELRACIDAQRTLERVNADRQRGLDAGVRGTPSVYVNGQLVENASYAGISQAIDAALQ